jgi:hypothetical protein
LRREAEPHEYRDIRGGVGDDHHPQDASRELECEVLRSLTHRYIRGVNAPDEFVESDGRDLIIGHGLWRPRALSLLAAGWRHVGRVDCDLFQYGLQQRHVRELRFFIAMREQL